MSTARGQANHQLYLARIILAAWGRDLDVAQLPGKLLGQAYFPAVREHLVSAYGWFLFEVSGISTLPEYAPRCCDDLLPPAPGKAESGEIREFRQLEAAGWLAELLRPLPTRSNWSTHSWDNLAVGSDSLPGPDVAADWADRLGGLFERMGDSLDEY